MLEAQADAELKLHTDAEQRIQDALRQKFDDGLIDAQTYFRHLRRQFLPDFAALCPDAGTPGRIAAILDFAFNLGAGSLRVSTLRRKINAAGWHEVPTQLRRWNKAGGRVLRGLTRRREPEIELL